MKRTSLLLSLLLCLLCWSGNRLSAQYSAVGARLGSPLSVSYKFFPSERAAVEVFAGFRSNKARFGNRSARYGSFSIGALYQVHNDLRLEGIEGLRWYYGGGVSAFFWSYGNDFIDARDYATTSIGLLGNLGLDYVFPNAPINLSIDWVPTILLGRGYSSGFGAGYGALSVRYVLAGR